MVFRLAGGTAIGRTSDLMGRTSVIVLILGERPEGASYLAGHLEQRGCQCWFAHSLEEAIARHEPQAFDLILSVKPMARPEELQRLLGGAPATAYSCYRVEDGCWWLPLLNRGQKSLGAPAFRPSEFIGELDRLVQLMQSEAQADAESASRLASPVHA
jgi:hypothetical protein